MRGRYHRMVLTIASGASIACSDAAVEQVTAPAAVKPTVPATNQYPYEWEYWDAGIPSAIGVSIDVRSWFETHSGAFVAEGHVKFSWANDVSATLRAWLLDSKGGTVNSGIASIEWYRIALPVPSGDTVLTVRVSTNNVQCGLVGKTEGKATAAQIALDARLVAIRLYSHSVGPKSGPDALQPACPPPPGCEAAPAGRVISSPTGFLASSNTTTDCDAPAPPGGGGDEEYEVCYTIWRELWIWDWLSNMYFFHSQWIVGVVCYVVTNAT